MTTDNFRCSDASLGRSEPMYGTASFVKRWLLIEQPGGWGSDALLESRMPVRVAKEIRARTRSLGIRVVLIRRGARLSTGRRRCFFLRTENCDSYAAHLSLDSPLDLLDLDLAPLREGGEVQGAAPLREPLFLVCTHGRHDACCSIKGNQVSRVACSIEDAEAWECSHIGGDRFAANLVCFPHGIYYGRVDPEDVPGLMSSYGEGRLSLAHYRGRCCFTFPLQAAEYFVRRELQLTDIDGISLVGSGTSEAGLHARFTVGDRMAQVQIRVSDVGPHRLTCGAASALPIPHYELTSIEIG